MAPEVGDEIDAKANTRPPAPKGTMWVNHTSEDRSVLQWGPKVAPEAKALPTPESKSAAHKAKYAKVAADVERARRAMTSAEMQPPPQPRQQAKSAANNLVKNQIPTAEEKEAKKEHQEQYCRGLAEIHLLDNRVSSEHRSFSSTCLYGCMMYDAG